MRTPLGVGGLVAAALVLSACSAATPAPRDTTSGPPIEAWQSLVADFNGFFTAYNDTTLGRRDRTPERVMKSVGYAFAGGNTLKRYEYSPRQQYVKACLAGADDTYVALKITDGAMTRTLGTGRCDYRDGDIALELLEPGYLKPGQKPGEHVTAGKKLARQVPALKDNPFDYAS